MTSVITRYGDMSIIDGDTIISRALALYGEWAMDELNLLSRIIAPGMCVLDVGAFIGTHTMAFSRFVGEKGKVYSFEPRKEIYEILTKNASSNNCTNVFTLNEGLADREQMICLDTIDISCDFNFGGLKLERASHSQGACLHQVKISTIDDLDFEKINVIKIDVEGMERRVLDGAVKVISRDKPIIFCECNSLLSGAQIIEFCELMSYEIFGFLSSPYNPSNFNSVNENIFGEAKELGLLLTPIEKSEHIKTSLSGFNLLKIGNIEDLVLPLLHKPQYAYEVLENTAPHEKLGINFPSPLVSERDMQITCLNRTASVREELLLKHLNELEKIQAQLTASEVAKTKAEELAMARYEEINLLRDEAELLKHDLRNVEGELDRRHEQLTNIQLSVGYKVLAALRLVPGRGSADV